MDGAFPPADQFSVAADGAVLAGERSGASSTEPPLVLVHGMAGDRHEWDGLLAFLPPDLPTIRYDLRGFGASSAEDIEFSHADDLPALLDALGIERAAILGLSMGGAVALNFALDHPERVSRLILISPWLTGWEASDDWRALWREVADAVRAGNLPLARERWFQHPMFAALREDADLAAELRHSIERYPGHQWLGDRQRPELPDIDRLHTLAVPTLLLTGERDHADLRLIAEVIEGAAPGVRRVDYAGAGHMLHMERRDDVARRVAGFVRA